MRLFLILLLCTTIIFGGQITPDGQYRKIKMKNTRSGEVSTYFTVGPGERVNFSTSAVDSISLITKVGVNSKDTLYTYKVDYDKQNKKISKKIKKSQLFRTLDGKALSSFNKYSFKFSTETKSAAKFSFTNTAKQEIYLKPLIAGNKTSKPVIKSSSVVYTPDNYLEEILVKNGKNSFNSFSGSTAKPLELVLEGPLTIKILSRMVLENNLDNKAVYSYKVFNNGKLLAEINCKSTKSGNAIIKGQENLAISKGFDNSINLPVGINHLKIESSNSNRKLLFRFYINKASLRGMNP